LDVARALKVQALRRPMVHFKCISVVPLKT